MSVGLGIFASSLPFAAAEAYELAAAWNFIEECQHEVIAEVLAACDPGECSAGHIALVHSSVALFIAHIFNTRQRESIVNAARQTVRKRMSRRDFEMAWVAFEKQLLYRMPKQSFDAPAQIGLYLRSRLFDD